MPPIGFSTGALARGDVQHGVQMLRGTTANAVELSALRQNELPVLVDLLDQLDLHQFEHVSVHAPSAIEAEYEDTALELLARVQERRWPIIVHPDAMHHVNEWSRFGECFTSKTWISVNPSARPPQTSHPSLPSFRKL